MRITFLGHQGWQFENNGRSFLLDPILEGIGNGTVRMPVWPNRRLEFSRMGPIDAVIISHEHADHFSLETLSALPSTCRIYISDLASEAMYSIIREMGFVVERFTAFNSFSINGIRIAPLPGLYNTLEPDVYALLMRDDSGASFLTGIDTVWHPDIFAWLAQHCPRRTLDNLTNNFLEPRQPLVFDADSHTKSRAIVANTMMEFVQKLQPQRVVISGQGWCFARDRDQYNHSFFSVDNEWLRQAAQTLAPHVEWSSGTPSQRFELRGDQVIVDNVDIATPLPIVDRRFDPQSVAGLEPFSPWSQDEAISSERLHAVQRFIVEEYGQKLGGYSPRLMEGLYYMKFQDCGDLNPTLHIVLRNGTSKYLYEFDYGLLQFGDVTTSVVREAVVGVEIWAADFELMITAKEEAFQIYETAVHTWSYLPAFLSETTLIECFMWFTPRFRPKETLAFYRKQLVSNS
jgi:phosphoribosyl 1,2-cyclic phosphodiesterase